MIDTAQQTQEDTEKVSLLTAVVGALSSKYLVMAVSAALLSLIALIHGSRDLTCLEDTAAAALICLLIRIIQFMQLKKLGLDRKMMIGNKKKVDPRLYNSLGDLNSIGSTIGTAAAISVVLSKLFIVNGGVFDSNELAIPLIEAIADALSVGTVISLITSKPSVRCSLYIIAGRTMDVSGNELLKKLTRASNNAGLMKDLRKMACLRVAAAVVISSAILVTALSGAGPAFSCAQTAILCMIAVELSNFCPKGSGEKLSEEKLPLFTKSGKRICTLNAAAVIIILFFFVFSFPFRSVYTEYTPVLDHQYDDVVSDSIDIFSIPAAGDESAALFNGVFLACALMITVISGAYALTGGFTSVRQISAEIICAVLSGAAAAVTGLVTKPALLNSVQYLVAVSAACLLIFVNFIAYLVRKRHSDASK